MNKSELIDALSEKLGGKSAATTAVEHFIETVSHAVARGERVAITGFGVFEKSDRAARTGRNPATGAPVKIKATSVPKFRPGAEFKAIVGGAKKTAKKVATKTVAKAAPVRKAAATKTVAAKAPAKKAPATKAAPVRKAAATKTVAAKAPAKKAPATKAAPARKTTAAKAAPVRKAAPAKKTVAAKAPAKKAPATKAPAKKAPAKKAR